MELRRLLPLVLVPVLGIGLVATACGGNDVSVDTPGGQVDVGDGGITVEGPSGEEVNIGTGDYPKGWPSDFPTPEGATPAYSVDAAGGVAVWFASDMSADELTAFFTDALPGAGFMVDSTVDLDDETGSYTVMTVSGNGWTGGIYMGEDLASVAPGFAGDFSYWVSLAPA